LKGILSNGILRGYSIKWNTKGLLYQMEYYGGVLSNEILRGVLSNGILWGYTIKWNTKGCSIKWNTMGVYYQMEY